MRSPPSPPAHPATRIPLSLPALLTPQPAPNPTPSPRQGTKITFAGKGDEKPGRPPADLQFVVEEVPNPRFKREGNDLHTTGAARAGSGVGVGAGAGAQAPFRSRRRLADCFRSILGGGALAIFTRLLPSPAPIADLPCLPNTLQSRCRL